MSSDVFTKDNLDSVLNALGKQYRKLNGTAFPAEIVLIGGAAVLVNYGFRDMTTDIDAVIHAASALKDAINMVGDKFHLPNGWLNSDFMHTASYSPKIDEFSEYYRTFSNVLRVRTIRAEYLVAMKLMSGRKYKNDLSDVIGILAEHEKANAPITLEDVKNAVINLYGSWDKIPPDSAAFIENAIAKGNYAQTFASLVEEEKRNKNNLLDFEKVYPNVMDGENIDTIIQALQRKQAVQKQKSQDDLEL